MSSDAIAYRARSLPSARVRSLVEQTKLAWSTLTDDERLDFLAMLNADRAPCDQPAVERMLAATGGNIGLAAKNLGIARRTLQNRMRAYGLPFGKRGNKKFSCPSTE